MIGRSALSLVVGLAALSLAAPGVSAQLPPGDSVTGTAAFDQSGYSFRFDAHSGPTGEAPHGTVTRLASPGVSEAVASVQCLRVVGHRATLTLSTEPFPPSEVMIFIEDTDGAGPDRVLTPPSASGCPLDPPAGSVLTPVQAGDIEVIDGGPAPTSTAECKSGGWQAFGTFESHADCVSFVIGQARQQCIFVRAARGFPTFIGWYATPVTKLHAMRRCVRQRSDG